MIGMQRSDDVKWFALRTIYKYTTRRDDDVVSVPMSADVGRPTNPVGSLPTSDGAFRHVRQALICA